MNTIYDWKDLFKLTSVKLWAIAITLGAAAMSKPIIDATMPWLQLPSIFWSICGVCAIVTGAAGTGFRNVKQDNPPIPKEMK